jgi:hypothetical protein
MIVANDDDDDDDDDKDADDDNNDNLPDTIINVNINSIPDSIQYHYYS